MTTAREIISEFTKIAMAIKVLACEITRASLLDGKVCVRFRNTVIWGDLRYTRGQTRHSLE